MSKLLLLIKIRNINIFFSYFQSLLKNLASKIIRIFILLGSGNIKILVFNISLMISPACICFDLAINIFY